MFTPALTYQVERFEALEATHLTNLYREEGGHGEGMCVCMFEQSGGCVSATSTATEGILGQRVGTFGGFDQSQPLK